MNVDASFEELVLSDFYVGVETLTYIWEGIKLKNKRNYTHSRPGSIFIPRTLQLTLVYKLQDRELYI